MITNFLFLDQVYKFLDLIFFALLKCIKLLFDVIVRWGYYFIHDQKINSRGYGFQVRLRTSLNFQKSIPYLPPDLLKNSNSGNFCEILNIFGAAILINTWQKSILKFIPYLLKQSRKISVTWVFCSVFPSSHNLRSFFGW